MSFVYITENLINDKKYLGKHNGKSQNYLGSVTILKKAIEKVRQSKLGRKRIYREDGSFYMSPKMMGDQNSY